MNSDSKIFINTDFLSTNILPYLLKRHSFRISTNKFVKSRLYGYTCGLCHCKYSAMCAVVMRGYVHNRSLAPCTEVFQCKSQGRTAASAESKSYELLIWGCCRLHVWYQYTWPTGHHWALNWLGLGKLSSSPFPLYSFLLVYVVSYLLECWAGWKPKEVWKRNRRC